MRALLLLILLVIGLPSFPQSGQLRPQSGQLRPQYSKLSPLLRRLAAPPHCASAPAASLASLASPALSPPPPVRCAAALPQPAATICAFVKATDAAALRQKNCRILLQKGNLFIAAIPIHQLAALSLDSRILRIEANRGSQLLTDSMALHLNALPAYAGQDLPQAYTGRGVVVGIMDVGFDLTHPNFYSRDTTEYRIHQFWDMLSQDTVGSTFPVGRDYIGREQLLQLQHSRDGLDLTHGTHTLGIAAGSGYDSPYRGMAPEADICLVANAVTEDIVYIDSADYYKYTFATDALGFKYIFDYAESKQQPCVISFSEGSGQDYWGYDQLYYEMLDSLTGPGRIIVAAAGNQGRVRSWIHKPSGQPSTGTFLRSYQQEMMITLKSTADFNMRFVAYTDSGDTLTLSSRDILEQPDSMLTAIQQPLPIINIVAYPSCYHPEETCYDITIIGNQTVGVSTPLSIELIGKEADIEVYRVSGTLTSNPLNPLLNAGECTHNIHSPSSAPCVISVGGTIYRRGIFNYLGKWKEAEKGSDGERGTYSSVGPTMDGRIKPDVMAPGANIISSYSSFYLEQHPLANDITWDVAHFPFQRRTYVWNSNSGTSMSCPAVAGAIALWLQAKPDLTPEDVIDVLSHSCRQPDSLLTYPNNLWGYGEIDVYRGLLYILGFDRIEEVASRHTATRIIISNGKLVVTMPEATASPVRLRVYALGGTLVLSQQLAAGQHTDTYTIPLPHLPAGVYAVQLDGSPGLAGSTLIQYARGTVP